MAAYSWVQKLLSLLVYMLKCLHALLIPRAVPDALRQPPADGGQIVSEQGIRPKRLHDRVLVVQHACSYLLRKAGMGMASEVSILLWRVFCDILPHPLRRFLRIGNTAHTENQNGSGQDRQSSLYFLTSLSHRPNDDGGYSHQEHGGKDHPFCFAKFLHSFSSRSN